VTLPLPLTSPSEATVAWVAAGRQTD
jgi:hypothetical protein